MQPRVIGRVSSLNPITKIGSSLHQITFPPPAAAAATYETHCYLVMTKQNRRKEEHSVVAHLIGMPLHINKAQSEGLVAAVHEFLKRESGDRNERCVLESVVLPEATWGRDTDALATFSELERLNKDFSRSQKKTITVHSPANTLGDEMLTALNGKIECNKVVGEEAVKYGDDVTMRLVATKNGSQLTALCPDLLAAFTPSCVGTPICLGTDSVSYVSDKALGSAWTHGSYQPFKNNESPKSVSVPIDLKRFGATAADESRCDNKLAAEDLQSYLDQLLNIDSEYALYGSELRVFNALHCSGNVALGTQIQRQQSFWRLAAMEGVCDLTALVHEAVGAEPTSNLHALKTNTTGTTVDTAARVRQSRLERQHHDEMAMFARDEIQKFVQTCVAFE